MLTKGRDFSREHQSPVVVSGGILRCLCWYVPALGVPARPLAGPFLRQEESSIMASSALKNLDPPPTFY